MEKPSSVPLIKLATTVHVVQTPGTKLKPSGPTSTGSNDTVIRKCHQDKGKELVGHFLLRLIIFIDVATPKFQRSAT